jgi:hypothetical protein
MNYRDYTLTYDMHGKRQYLVVDEQDRVVYVARGNNEQERIDDARAEQSDYPYRTRVYCAHGHYGPSGFVSLD